MAKIANINLPSAADAKVKTAIPTVVLDGDTVARYNAARDQLDKAEAVMNELKPELYEAGLGAVFSHNCTHSDDPKALVSSVNLKDKPPEDSTADAEEVVQFTWTKKNLANDKAQVEVMFGRVLTTEGKKANANNYVGYAVQAAFDPGVFMVDGEFNEKRHTAFMEAVGKVALRFKVENPLSCTKVLAPKPDFHLRRWTQFDLKTNRLLQTVLPTQLNLKPIRPENGNGK